jgi:NitT/TauT family transport system substrate-binding protein
VRVRGELLALAMVLSVGCGARPAAAPAPGASGAPAASPSSASRGATSETGAAPGGAEPSGGAPAQSTAPAAARSGDAPPALVPFKAAYSAVNFAQSPLILAKEAGYFAQQGLDVEFVSVRSSSQFVAAVMTREIEAGVSGGTAVITGRLGGADIVMIGATKPYFAGGLSVRPEITTADDLRGKRIGITTKGSNPEMMVRALLPRLGLDADRDVALLVTGNNPETFSALLAGSVDAASLTPPGDERARNLGFPTLIDVTAARLPYAATVLVTGRPTLADRSEAIERFLRGYALGVHRYLTDKPYALTVGAAFLQSDDVAANEQGYEAERAIMQADLDLPLAAVQAALDLMRGDDPRAAEARADEFVDLRPLNRIKQSGFLDRLAAEPATR